MTLNFLAPLALFGLIALVIPLYLHLRHRPRAIPLPFSAIEFLLAAKRKRRKRLRFEQFLLMLARVLLLVALAFLFSRPVLDAFFSNAPGFRSTPYIVILDDSASMLAGPSKSRFFHEAKAQIADLLSHRPSSAPTYLMPASDADAFSEESQSQTLLTALASWRPTLQHVTLDQAYEKAVQLVGEKQWARATIHIFSDGSATAWNNPPNQLPAESDVILTSMRRQLRSFSNSGVVSVQQPLASTGAEIEVSLHHSTSSNSRVDVALFADDQQVLNHSLNLAPWSTTTHRFDLGETDVASIEIRIPDDDFDLDNRVFHAPHHRKKTRVLIVDGDTQPNPKESESFFFANALGPKDESSYEVEVITPSGLKDRILIPYDVVCLLNVAAPPHQKLLDAMGSGTGVFVSMGNRIDYESWNPLLREFALDVWETKHLPSSHAVNLKLPDHRVFSQIPVHEWEMQLQGLSIQAFRLFSVGRSSFRIPLSLDDGTPVLLAQDTSTARILIWTSTVDLSWTNFPLQFAFLPLIRQSIDYLSGQDALLPITYMTVDEVAQSDIRDQMRLKFSAPVFDSIEVDGPLPGLYSVKKERNTEWISVNLDEAESDFRPFSRVSESPESSEVAAGGTFKEAVRTELGTLFLWLLFILVLLETGLATYISAKWGGR